GFMLVHIVTGQQANQACELLTIGVFSAHEDYFLSFAKAAAMAPRPAASCGRGGAWRRAGLLAGPRRSSPVRRTGGASSFKRIVNPMRLRAASTSCTLTLTICPTRTTSRGSLTKVSDRAEI